jgi:4a-hydroxytetrahydrobiopterin dehydratase
MNPTSLAQENLQSCRKGTPALQLQECRPLLLALQGWELKDKDGTTVLQGRYAFPDFAAALAFANKVGALAEAANHHPALLVEWGSVTVQWWTHSINGLHRNDFVMAARCDALFSP